MLQTHIHLILIWREIQIRLSPCSGDGSSWPAAPAVDGASQPDGEQQRAAHPRHTGLLQRRGSLQRGRQRQQGCQTAKSNQLFE